jgi:uncharacterized protein involved in exopolysaccharide biosynthesis
LGLKATLSKEHPDVIALKKKIEVMENEVGTRHDLRKLYGELHAKKQELEKLSESLSEKHPDIIKLTREVRQLEEEVESISAEQGVLRTFEEERPENPSYINLQTQISSTQMEIDKANQALNLLKEEHQEYRTRVENTPKAEQEYRALYRDYSNAQAKYQETTNRLLAAKEAKGLEESRMGEKFTLIDPPVVPEKPDRPNRLAIMVIGLMLASGAGAGCGSLAQYMDHSVREPDELTRISGHAVLAVIPYLQTPLDLARRRRRRWAFFGGTIGFVVLGIAALHYWCGPLDILWIKVVRYLYIRF